jgi:tetratricopeptide (TPR) repeat protein
LKIIKYIFIFSFVLGYSQDNDNDNFIAAYSNACDCIAEISLEADDKNELIANCISLSLEKLETNQQSTSEKSPELNYKKIENYLVQNCESLKNIAFSENKKFKHASSENVLAQLAYDDGMDYINNDDVENAIQKFQKAVDIDPKFAFAWDNLGISYRKNQEYDKAIEAYQKSLEIYAQGRLPLLNISITYNLNKDYEQAIIYYKKFIAIYSEDPEGYYGLGLILYTQGQQEEGLDNLVRAYTIYTAQNSPYRADAAKKIGYMYKDLKNQDKLEVFNKVADKYNLKVQNN